MRRLLKLKKDRFLLYPQKEQPEFLGVKENLFLLNFPVLILNQIKWFSSFRTNDCLLVRMLEKKNDGSCNYNFN